MILCESRSLAGVLDTLAGLYACPIASTNGQCRGFLITKVASVLETGQRVLYLGDWDRGGHQIEAATRRTLVQRAWPGTAICPTTAATAPGSGVALTEHQVADNDLPVIQKLDRRYNGGNGERGRYFDAVETEAFGQANIVAALRARLDELMPEPTRRRS